MYKDLLPTFGGYVVLNDSAGPQINAGRFEAMLARISGEKMGCICCADLCFGTERFTKTGSGRTQGKKALKKEERQMRRQEEERRRQEEEQEAARVAALTPDEQRAEERAAAKAVARQTMDRRASELQKR